MMLFILKIFKEHHAKRKSCVCFVDLEKAYAKYREK